MSKVELTVGRLLPDSATYPWFQAGILNDSIKVNNIGDNYARGFDSYCMVWIAQRREYVRANVGDTIVFDSSNGQLSVRTSQKAVDNSTIAAVRALATNTSRAVSDNIITIDFDQQDINDSILRAVQRLSEFARQRDVKSQCAGKTKLTISLK